MTEEQAHRLKKICSDFELDFKKSNFVEDFKQKWAASVKAHKKNK